MTEIKAQLNKIDLQECTVSSLKVFLAQRLYTFLVGSCNLLASIRVRGHKFLKLEIISKDRFTNCQIIYLCSRIF